MANLYAGLYENGSYVDCTGREMKVGDIVKVSYGFEPTVSTYDGGHDVVDAEHFVDLILVTEEGLVDPLSMDPMSTIAVFADVGDYAHFEIVGTATENPELLSEVKNVEK